MSRKRRAKYRNPSVGTHANVTALQQDVARYLNEHGGIPSDVRFRETSGGGLQIMSSTRTGWYDERNDSGLRRVAARHGFRYVSTHEYGITILKNVPRENPAAAQKKSSAVPAILGALAVGGAVYLLAKRSSAAPMPPQLPGSIPTTRIPSVNAPVPAPMAGVSPTPSGVPAASSSLISRLQNSQNARLIFALQAMAYSYRYTDATPDGIEGPVTDGIIRSTTNLPRFTPDVLGGARIVIEGTPAATEMAPRVLPFTLPSSVIASINTDQMRVDPGALLVQAWPATSPAGQAMPYASYSRIPSVLPGNTVGANPGYGVTTDPYGLNMGIWQALGGGGRYAPSGVMQADLGRNPIAGQAGGYFRGYPGVTAMNRLGRY